VIRPRVPDITKLTPFAFCRFCLCNRGQRSFRAIDSNRRQNRNWPFSWAWMLSVIWTVWETVFAQVMRRVGYNLQVV
jgi:hypothetical protein